MLRIGLTGNIACGKSTVAAILAGLGAVVIDADKIGHEVMRCGTETYRLVVDRFGKSILGPDSEIDRRTLGAIVFADPAALSDLDRLVHPAVIQRVEERIAGLHPAPEAVVIEAVKLVEAGMHHRCDSVWLVVCSPQVARHRLMASRGLTEPEAQARIDAQGNDREKRRIANVVIANDGDIEHAKKQVRTAWWRLTDRERNEPVVKLATVANEMVAGMVISVLEDEKILAMSRSRGVGIGGWASSALMEHDLFVRAGDWERAVAAIQDFAGDEVTIAEQP